MGRVLPLVVNEDGASCTFYEGGYGEQVSVIAPMIVPLD